MHTCVCVCVCVCVCDCTIDRKKAKRKELLQTGAISKKMPKVMAETLTKQSLQLDYAALPCEERQQLEQAKADAKVQWLHTDSLAFKFWEATEKYLSLESLTLGGRDTDRGTGDARFGECLNRTSALCLYCLSH